MPALPRHHLLLADAPAAGARTCGAPAVVSVQACDWVRNDLPAR